MNYLPNIIRLVEGGDLKTVFSIIPMKFLPEETFRELLKEMLLATTTDEDFKYVIDEFDGYNLNPYDDISTLILDLRLPIETLQKYFRLYPSSFYEMVYKLMDLEDSEAILFRLESLEKVFKPDYDSICLLMKKCEEYGYLMNFHVYEYLKDIKKMYSGVAPKPSYIITENTDKDDSSLYNFRKYGPRNAFPVESKQKVDLYECTATGGCRMFSCMHFEHNNDPENQEPKDDWFTGVCRECSINIKNRKYAVRRPLKGGGFVSCFCSFECMRNFVKPDEIETEMIHLIEKNIFRKGIYDE